MVPGICSSLIDKSIDDWTFNWSNLLLNPIPEVPPEGVWYILKPTLPLLGWSLLLLLGLINRGWLNHILGVGVGLAHTPIMIYLKFKLITLTVLNYFIHTKTVPSSEGAAGHIHQSYLKLIIMHKILIKCYVANNNNQLIFQPWIARNNNNIPIGICVFVDLCICGFVYIILLPSNNN